MSSILSDFRKRFRVPYIVGLAVALSVFVGFNIISQTDLIHSRVLRNDRCASFTTKQFLLDSSVGSDPPHVGAAFARKNQLTEAELFHPTSLANPWDLYAPEVGCPSLSRIGSVGDGGKWICDVDWLSKIKRPCTMFSYGVEADSSFEAAILVGTNCKVFAFDPSIGGVQSQRKYGKDLFYDHGDSLKPKIGTNVVQPLREKRIRFEKLALSSTSMGAGSKEKPSRHVLNEAISDTMSRHHVPYLDLLKVDAEGAEWSALYDLFDGCATKGQPSPVGQLSVELHYQSMVQLETLFDRLKMCGFVSVSRETNVQPCVNQGFCHAAEYTFIHPQRYYADNVGQVLPAATTRSRDEWLAPPSAVVYLLSQRKRLGLLSTALQLLYVNFWVVYPYYPIVVFHDDFTAEDEAQIRRSIFSVGSPGSPPMDLHFIRIKLDFPAGTSATDKERLQEQPPQYKICRGTLGYRHMCRFHAFVAEAALEEHGFNQDYIMRIDDDSQFSSPVGYDLFRVMHINSKRYGFVKLMRDDPMCVSGLWAEAEKLIENVQLTNPPLLSKQKASLLHNTSATDTFYALMPSPTIFYNNFEIIHRSVTREPLWVAWREHIERTQGIYYARWGDAPIKSIGVSLVVKKDELHAFTDIPYRHLPFIDQSSTGLPMPFEDPFLVKAQCTFFDKWTCTRNKSAIVEFDMFLPLPSWQAHSSENVETGSEDKSDGEDTLHRLQRTVAALTSDEIGTARSVIANAVLVPHSSTPQNMDDLNALLGAYQGQYTQNAIKGVLYTYVFADFEETLARTVSSFYKNLASYYSLPFVVFFTENGKFSLEKTNKILQDLSCKAKVTFIPVPLNSLSQAELYGEDGACVAGTPEGRSASLFLRQGVQPLLIELGYEYLWRFSMDSALKDAVTFDVFDGMRENGHEYGFHGIIRENPACMANAWKLAKSICAGTYVSGLPIPDATKKDNVHCSSSVFTWDETAIFFSNFEISHSKLWQNGVVRTFLDEALALDQKEGRIMWGDGLVHTIAVLMALEETSISTMKHIPYEAYGAFGYAKGNLKIEEEPSPLPALTSYFMPKRFGWLGSDVAASFALPHIPGSSSTSSKYIWLFGDTLIGTSTTGRRLEAAMISNSVGIATISDSQKSLGNTPGQSWHPFSDVKYYWGSDTSGTPQSVLHLESTKHYKQLTDSNKDKLIKKIYSEGHVWPTSGVAIDSSVVIVGKVSKNIESSSRNPLLQSIENSMAFEESGTVLIVVTNPNAAPDQWITSTSLLPSLRSDGGFYRWYTVAAVSTAEPESAQIYLQGVYSKHAGARSTFDVFSTTSKKLSYAVIARLPASSLLAHDMSKLEVLTAAKATGSSPQWMAFDVKSDTNPHAIAQAMDESSLTWDSGTGQWVLLSLVPLDHIRVCRSSGVELTSDGAWSCSTVRLPKDVHRDAITAYGAKVHPELLPPLPAGSNKQSRLIISLATNVVRGPKELLREEHFDSYIPKFYLL
jgi:hypothetical protein